MERSATGVYLQGGVVLPLHMRPDTPIDLMASAEFYFGYSIYTDKHAWESGDLAS